MGQEDKRGYVFFKKIQESWVLIVMGKKGTVKAEPNTWASGPAPRELLLQQGLPASSRNKAASSALIRASKMSIYLNSRRILVLFLLYTQTKETSELK